MSHNIHVEKGKAAIMWTGEPPWHGLGQELAGPATAEQAIQAAGLDWEVGVQPVYAQGGSHSLRVPRAFAVVPLHRWGEAACPVYGLVSAGLRHSPEMTLLCSPRVTQHHAGAVALLLPGKRCSCRRAIPVRNPGRHTRAVDRFHRRTDVLLQIEILTRRRRG